MVCKRGISNGFIPGYLNTFIFNCLVINHSRADVPPLRCRLVKLLIADTSRTMDGN